MDSTEPGSVNFLNLEYFFRLLYDARFGAEAVPFDFGVLLAQAWSLTALIAYTSSIVALGIIIYSLIRMSQVLAAEEHLFHTIEFAEADKEVDHSRWNHVVSLIEGSQENDWRQAIIEADIMLEEVLVEQGLPGDTIGDRLKAADPAHFKTLDNAWAAHKVRNEIAHQGSAFKLDDNLAYRTIKQYESVFREFNTI